jgi:hypothetical protein
LLLGRADLTAMQQGAVDPAGRQQTLLASWLGLAGCTLYVAVLAVAVAYLGLIIRLFVNSG